MRNTAADEKAQENVCQREALLVKTIAMIRNKDLGGITQMNTIGCRYMIKGLPRKEYNFLFRFLISSTSTSSARYSYCFFSSSSINVAGYDGGDCFG